MNRPAIWTLAALISFPAASPASFIVSFTQSGANVVATGSGTINLTDLALFAVGDEKPFVHAELGHASVGVWDNENNKPAFVGLSGPLSFGPGGYFDTPVATGDPIAILGNAGFGALLVLPSGYVSGVRLSNTTTWSNTTISGLGLTPGTYTWTWGAGANADFLTVQIGAVPEPSSLVLCGIAGALALGYAKARRRAA